MGKKSFLLRRFFQTIIIIFAIMTLIFFMFRLIPADPTSILVDSQFSPEARKLLLAEWGLDKPLYIQYFIFIKNLIKGDFGLSFVYRKPAFDVIFDTIWNTLVLMGLAMFIAFSSAVIGGAYLGWKRGKLIEKIGVIIAVFFQAMPLFWTGIITLILFSYWIRIFPTGGMHTLGSDIGTGLARYFSIDFLYHLCLPIICASLYYMAHPLLIMRTSMLEIKGEDFLEMNLAKGYDEKLLIKQCARNALLPVVTHAAIMSGFVFGGQVLLETVFSWPGMGKELVRAVMELDYPVAQAAFFLMAVTVVSMNFFVDILYGYLDPRIVYK